jgi:type I restriction enzyme S subunit
MNPQQFLADFRHLANAPGGVSRLRKLVLALAVQGRLVPQLESEEPAASQLARVATAAANRPTAGRRKKALPASRFEVGTTAVPNGWARTHLCDLVRVLNGRAYSKQELLESGTPVLRVGNLFTSDHWYYSNLELEADKYADTGDLLFAWSASFGPFIWEGGRVIFHYHIWKLDLFSHEDLNKRFLYTWLLEKTQEIKASGHGISMAHMTKERFEALEISLPPLEEQSRIVAKVDELMALCDQLELQQKDRRKLQNAMRQATLQAMVSAQSPHELRTSWERLQANFGRLFSEPKDVAELRSLLVELAIRGVLTPESVQVLRDEQAIQGVLQSVPRTGRRFAKVTHVAPPFDLPSTWTWALFDDLLDGSDSGWSPKCDTEPRRPGEWGVLKVSAVTWGEFRAEENKRLPPSLDPRPECEVKAGDFLLSRANTADLVARSVIAPPDVQDRLLMSDKIVRLSFVDSELKPWANLVNNSQFAREHYRSNATGTSDSMRNVSRQVIHELPIPLPPKHVQMAVMQRLAELNELCGSLEGGLRNKALYSARLTDAAVAALTGITIEQEEDTAVKAPQTELIAPLRLAVAPDVKAQAPLATILARHEGEMAARDLWQRFGGEIDAFYAQLKTEVAHGWIAEPEPAQVREKSTAETAKV